MSNSSKGKKEKRYRARDFSAISLQFYYSKQEGCWMMRLTVNDENKPLSSMDASLFGHYLGKDEHLDKNQKKWLVNVIEGLKYELNLNK